MVYLFLCLSVRNGKCTAVGIYFIREGMLNVIGQLYLGVGAAECPCRTSEAQLSVCHCSLACAHPAVTV